MFRKIKRAVRRWPLVCRVAKTYLEVREWLFDMRYQVETRGLVRLDKLTVTGGHRDDGVQYEPVYPEEMAEILSQLDIDFPRYAFVDFGSGKGRALIVAATHPFKRIVGVEFARELHEIAVRNIRTYGNPAQRCFQIESVHADASEYELPLEPLVLYFNNPFRKSVMSAVIENVAQSLTTSPRPAFVVSYGRWTLTEIIERLPGIHLRSKGSFYSIYEVPERISGAIALGESQRAMLCDCDTQMENPSSNL
jgi:predicted RNA methylase